MINIDIAFASLEQLASLLSKKDISSQSICAAYLDRINSLDPTLHACTEIFAEQAMRQAEIADEEIANGIIRSKFHGLPFLAKDLYDVAGHVTHAGAPPHLMQQKATRDATMIARLKEAGMVLLGKTHTVQFAYGGAGVNNSVGTPHNPWQQEAYLPGGSSSGSGVAVAAGMVPCALGTDTGGSVRIPASMNGITGLKTTVGRISRANIYPLSPSMDSAGPLCRTVSDTANIFDLTHGYDVADPTTYGRNVSAVLQRLNDGVMAMNIGIARGLLFEGIDSEVEKHVLEAAHVFKHLGANLSEVDFSLAAKAAAMNKDALVIAAEAYVSNKKWVDHHFEELDPIVAYRMLNGKEVAASELLKNYKNWHKIRFQTEQFMQNYDALLCPTVMMPAPSMAQTCASTDSYKHYNISMLRNTAIGNVLNLCALSLPCGFSTNGLPIGLMVYCKPFAEETLLRIGQAFQTATDWHNKTPNLNWVQS